MPVFTAPEGPKDISPGQSVAPPRVPETGRPSPCKGNTNAGPIRKLHPCFALSGRKTRFAWPDTQGVALG